MVTNGKGNVHIKNIYVFLIRKHSNYLYNAKSMYIKGE